MKNKKQQNDNDNDNSNNGDNGNNGDDDNQNELITNAINQVTEKLSHVLLEEFLKLPKELQISLVLIKSAQLLLANILCQVVMSKEELENITNEQGIEIKELTFNCAYSGFLDKFSMNKDKH